MNVYQDAKRIAQEIFYFNLKYFGEQMELAPTDPDPDGYECEIIPKYHQQIKYQDEMICVNKTIPNCSKVKYFSTLKCLFFHEKKKKNQLFSSVEGYTDV